MRPIKSIPKIKDLCKRRQIRKKKESTLEVIPNPMVLQENEGENTPTRFRVEVEEYYLGPYESIRIAGLVWTIIGRLHNQQEYLVRHRNTYNEVKYKRITRFRGRTLHQSLDVVTYDLIGYPKVLESTNEWEVV